MTTTFKNLEEFHLARGSKNSLESDYGGENHDDLGIFQTGNSTKHILWWPTWTAPATSTPRTNTPGE